jgi:hypothetical protein
MPNLHKDFSNKSPEEKNDIAIELVVALRAVRQELEELKDRMRSYEPGLDEHPMQDAFKDYGIFGATDAKFEAVLGPYKPV